MMERQLTKCCKAELDVERDDNFYPIRILCVECDGPNPQMEWVEQEEETE